MLELDTLIRRGFFHKMKIMLTEAKTLGFSYMKITTVPQSESDTVYLIVPDFVLQKRNDSKAISSLESKLFLLFEGKWSFSISTEEDLKEGYARAPSSSVKTMCLIKLQCAIPLKNLKDDTELDVQFAHAAQTSEVLRNYDYDLWLYGSENPIGLIHLKKEDMIAFDDSVADIGATKHWQSSPGQLKAKPALKHADHPPNRDLEPKENADDDQGSCQNYYRNIPRPMLKK